MNEWPTAWRSIVNELDWTPAAGFDAGRVDACVGSGGRGRRDGLLWTLNGPTDSDLDLGPARSVTGGAVFLFVGSTGGWWPCTRMLANVNGDGRGKPEAEMRNASEAQWDDGRSNLFSDTRLTRYAFAGCVSRDGVTDGVVAAGGRRRRKTGISLLARRSSGTQRSIRFALACLPVCLLFACFISAFACLLGGMADPAGATRIVNKKKRGVANWNERHTHSYPSWPRTQVTFCSLWPVVVAHAC